MKQESTSAPKSQSAFSADDAIRPELRDMAPYVPILPYEVVASRLGISVNDVVKLDANENPYGPAPSVRTELAKAPFLHIYPDPESTQLRDALAEYTGLSAEFLFVGAGADELIDLLFRLFITPGSTDSIVNAPPTFGMYKFDADVNGAAIINVNRGEDFSVDISAIEREFAARPANPPKIIFLASPNNPDGSVLSDADITRLLALPTLVVLDEAYFEFAPSTRIHWVPAHPNLIVLRTFSKWAGLAGMRIGYAAIPHDIIKHLWKIKQPYNVSVAAQTAALSSLREKGDLLRKVDALIHQRAVFYTRVAESFDWLHPLPSSSNYVLCRVRGGRNAADVHSILAKQGILIRYYTARGLSDCIRVSMGTEPQMEKLYAALGKL